MFVSTNENYLWKAFESHFKIPLKNYSHEFSELVNENVVFSLLLFFSTFNRRAGKTRCLSMSQLKLTLIELKCIHAFGVCVIQCKWPEVKKKNKLKQKKKATNTISTNEHIVIQFKCCNNKSIWAQKYFEYSSRSAMNWNTRMKWIILFF